MHGSIIKVLMKELFLRESRWHQWLKKKKKTHLVGRRYRDMGSIPELGRSPGEGNGNPLQCSCLKNPKDRGAWQAMVRGIAELDRLSKQAPGRL